MENYYRNMDTIQGALIGALLILAGIYLLAGHDIVNNTTLWVIVGIILIIKGFDLYSFIKAEV